MKSEPIFAVLILVSVLGGTGCARHAVPVTPAATRALVRGANQFALDLYAHLTARPGNLLVSPLSVHGAVGMAYAGARGATAQAMAATMHYPAPPAALGAMARALGAQLAAAPGAKRPAVELSIANALWGQRGVPFEHAFTAGLERDYGAGLRRVDFAAAAAAADAINHWVAQSTHGRIREIVSGGVLNARTRLVVANAVYFLGTWRKQFPPRETRPDVFHLGPDSSASVPMMAEGDKFDELEASDFQALRLPYADGRTSMIVLLPRAVDGLPSLERSLRADSLAAWLGRLRPRFVIVTVPRFTFRDEFALAPTLGAMGMGAAFGPAADFTGMSREGGLFISDVLHEAFIAVGEHGTEAAAATAVPVTLSMSGPPVTSAPVTFKADHPFLFLIRHDPSGAIVFLGRVADPR